MDKPRKKLYGRESQLQLLIETFHKIVPERKEGVDDGVDDGVHDGVADEAQRQRPDPKDQDEDGLVKDPDTELPQSMTAFEASFSIPHRPILTLITGPSGTGKTSLATALADYVQTHQGNHSWAGVYFISGKFDQFSRLENMGTCFPIKAALNSYFKLLVMREPPHVVDQLGEELLRRLSADYLLLMNAIPALYEILLKASQNQSTNDDTTTEASTLGSLHESNFGSLYNIQSNNKAATEGDERIRFVIRSILQIVCSAEKPVILLIDDWQWADDASLELIQEIIQDFCIQGLMLLGACRGNEVGLDDKLAVMLRDLEDKSICEVVDVQVSNLSVKDVETLVRETLVVPKTKFLASVPYAELATFVHRQTGGNPFGTQQMLEFLATEISLVEDKAIDDLPGYFEHRIATKMQSIDCDTSDLDTLVSLVLLRTTDLPQEIQDILKTGSCLGKDFNARVVAAALELEYGGIESALNKAQHLELLSPIPDRPDYFHFVHDKIQEASYKMIPDASKETIHASIGRNVKEAMSREEIAFDAPLLVDQFRRSLSLFTSEEDRVALADLCLQAARSRHHSSSISASMEYLELGLSLIPGRRPFRDYYELSLELNCSAAEMYYAAGQHEKTAAIVERIVGVSTNKADTARAESILIFSLGSQHMIVEAMGQSLRSLKQLGEPLPPRIGALNVLMEARKTAGKLRKLSDTDILMLPQMTDSRKLISLNILNIVFLYNFSSRPPAAAVIAMRMVRLSLEGGLSAMSAIGFAAYGMIISNGFEDMANGARFGKLALRIYSNFSKPEWYCRVNVLVWACLLPGHLPIRQCTPFMRKAGIAGLATGDIEFAMLGVVLYTAYSIISARPLGVLFKEGLDFLDRMKLHRQDLVLLWHLPLIQVISTLTEDTKTGNPSVLTGKYMNEKEVLDEAFFRKNISTITVIFYNKLTLAVTMGNWNAAEQACIAWEKDCDFSTIMVPVQDYSRFMMALASLVQLRSGTKGTRRRRSRARRYLNVLRKRLPFSEENYFHRVALLEAEEAMSLNRREVALDKYQQAIDAAGEQSFWMEQGIACERMSVCLSDGKNELSDESVERLLEAKQAYENWGATAKVNQLNRLIKTSRSAEELSNLGFRALDKKLPLL